MTIDAQTSPRTAAYPVALSLMAIGGRSLVQMLWGVTARPMAGLFAGGKALR